MAKVEILNVNGVVVSSGDVMSNVAITGTGDNAKLKVYKGGLVSGGSIAGAGTYTLAAGGILEDVTLNLGATNTANGILSNCTIQNGGSKYTNLNGGSAFVCTVAATGRLNVQYGATGSGNQIYGKLYLNGTTIQDTFVYDGAEVNLRSASGIHSLLDGAVVSGGTVDAAAGDMQDVTVYGGTVKVSSGCFADTITMNGGAMTVSSGALATDVTITNGTVTVLSAGTVSGATVNGGSMTLSSGAVGSDVTMTGGTVSVSGGAAVSGLTATGGSVAVSKGATLTDATLSGLTTYSLAQGAVFENVTLNLNAANTVYGLLSSCTIQNGTGVGTTLNTGSAYACTVAAGGRLNASNGAAGSGNQIYGKLYLYGITFENTTIYNGAEAHVQAYNTLRGLMDGVVISGGVVSARQGDVKNVTMYDGEIQVSSGCYAATVTISGGTMTVSSGGLGNNVTMYDGQMNVLGGAVASGVAVSGGTLTVSKGGLVSGGAITGAAAYTLADGGILENVTLNLNAANTVYGLLSSCTIQNGTGTGTTLNTGSAYDCTVAAGARLNASNGAAGSGNQIYGKLYLYGITFENTTVYDGGEVNVQGYYQSRGLMDGVVISGGVISARQGDVQNVTMYNGEMQVSSGCYAATVTISGGSMTVSSGGLGNNVTMYDGQMNVLGGGVASGVAVSGGTVNVSSSGAASDVTVSAGSVNVLNGGTAFGITMNGGAVNVSSDGAVSNGIVNTNGILTVSTGASVTGVSLAGGAVSVAGTADLTATAGTFAYADDAVLLTNGEATEATISAGSVTMDGGSYAQATVRGGELTLQNHATGDELAVSGGTVTVADTAIVSNVMLTGGTVNVSGGAMASAVTISGGTMTVSSAGTVSAITMTGGTMTLSSGATASGLTMTAGAVTVSKGGLVSGGSITGAADYTLADGGILENVTLNLGAGKKVYGILSSCAILNGGASCTTLWGGSAYGCTVVSGGRLDVDQSYAAGSGNQIYGQFYLRGGAFADTTLYQGGEINAQFGTMDGIIVSGGTLKVRNSTVQVQNVTMYNGEIQVSSGCSAAAVNVSGGTLTVSKGGLVSGGAITGAAAYTLADGGILENVTLNLNTANTVYGLLSSCTIQNGTGTGTTLNTGSAYDCTVAAGARLNASNGAAGSGNQIYGKLYLYGITFENTTVYDGGEVNVQDYHQSRGLMDGVVISGGVISARQGDVQNVTMYNGEMQVSSGCSATTVIVSGGTMTATGAVISGAVIHGGDVNFSSGCSVTNLVLANDNPALETELINAELTNAELDHVLVVRSSANGSVKVRGTITVSARFWMESKVTTTNAIDATGATFVFDLSRRNTDSTLINKLDCVIGASYAIQVGSDLAAGEYVLAGQANTFTDAITVKSGDTVRGTITVGNTLVSGDNFYTLAVKADNKMYFTAASSLVKDLAVTVDSGSTVVSWDAVTGATYQVSVDGGTSWESVSGSSYTYTGVETKDIQVRMADTQGNYGTVSKITVAGTAAATKVDDLVSSAAADATIVLRDGEYSGTGAVTMKAGQTLEGQGADSTTVANAIYGAGNAVVVKELTASKNVVGGRANAAATSTDLTVSSATLKDAFAGVLVNNGSYNVGTMTASLSGTYFRNLYGAGYVTGSAHVLTADAVNLAISGGSSSGSTYGAGRAANSATLNVTSVNLTVDNPAINGSLGAVYAGGYANSASTLIIGTANTTINTGWFTKFVAGGSQVYGEGTSATATATNLTISGGNFDNAVLGASYAAGGATATVTTATTTISGGTFSAFVAGGGFVNDGTVTVGSTDLTISGGTFTKYIFGGNLCSNKGTSTITGQAHVTLDTTENSISAAAIYAGSLSYAGVTATVGSTLLELKGDGSKLSFTHMYGSNANPQTAIGVTGAKELFFNGFSGNLAGKLYNFDTFTMTDSMVAFTKPQDLTDVTTWNLNLTGDVTDEVALLDWSNGGANAFSGDTMNLTFDADSTTDLLVIEGAEGLDLSLSEGMTVKFNGNAASYADGAWSLDGWKLSNVQTTIEESTVNNLVLSKTALS